jgi:hypothetical protein
MADITFLMTLVLAGTAAAIVFLFLVVMPRVRGRTHQRALEATGVRIGEPAEGHSESGMTSGKVIRVLVVPRPAPILRDALLKAASVLRGTQPQIANERVMTFPERRLRFWNVNRVNALDFAKAELEFDAASTSETRVVVRVDFTGYWRAVMVVGLFTAWAAFVIWITFHGHLSPLPAITVLVIFGIFFLTIRYTAQRQSTRDFFDKLVLGAMSRSGESSSRPE